MAQQRFADQLRFHRQAGGFSQEELAEKAGLSVRAISDLERGVKQRPQSETVRLLATALNLTGDTLIAFRLSATGRTESLSAPATASAETTTPIPQPLTALIGRENDVAAISYLLEPGRGPRLVTLTGPGGVGKTRLATHLAHAMASRFRHGVALIELASVTIPEQVIPVIALALGIREHPERSPLDTVIKALAAEQRLLVLDNLEQVIEIAPAIGQLLTACPELVILATSRSPLRLAGEHEIDVLPLAMADPTHVHASERLMRYPAVRLFVERAQSVRPEFTVSAENAQAIAAICHAVDGLPLAIELAAVRMKVLRPADLVVHLGQRLDVLSRGPRNLPARHQALRETIAWSNNLLTPESQAAFRSFSVFVGGASLESVADVLFEGDRLAAIDAVTDLHDQSLLQVHDGPEGSARFQMLETIREFAAEQLTASTQADGVRHRHADHFLQMAEEGEAALIGPNQARWMRTLETDYGNLRSAMVWFVGQQKAEGSQRMGSALWRFWAASGRLREARDFLDRALALEPDLATPARGRALLRAGNVELEFYQLRRSRLNFQQSIEILNKFDETVLCAGAHLGLGIVCLDLGLPHEAWVAQQFALATFRSEEVGAGVSKALQNLAAVELARGNLTESQRYLDEAIAIRKAAGDELGAAYAEYILGQVALADGKYETALVLFDRAGNQIKAMGDELGVGLVQLELATLAMRMGDLEKSYIHLRNAYAPLAEDDGLTHRVSWLERYAEWQMMAENLVEVHQIVSAIDHWYATSERSPETIWRRIRNRVMFPGMDAMVSASNNCLSVPPVLLDDLFHRAGLEMQG